MLHDYWLYRPDSGGLARWVPHTRGVTDWYAAHLRPDGLLGVMPWWNFGDWTRDFDFGVPPAGRGRGLGPALALLHGRAPRRGGPRGLPRQCSVAADDRQQAAGIGRAVRERCWVESRGLLADTPAHSHYSEQTNAMGVLLDAVPEDRRERSCARSSAAKAQFAGRGRALARQHLLPLLRGARPGPRRARGPLPRFPRAVEADARAWPHDMGGNGRAHALGRPCVERPPELRPPDPGRRHPPRVARRFGRSSSLRTWARWTPSAPGCPTPQATFWSATAGPATAGTSRSTCPGASPGTFLWAGRSTPLAEGSNRLAY